jgi:hypothetical protein
VWRRVPVARSPAGTAYRSRARRVRGRTVGLAALAAAGALGLTACGGSGPEGGEFDPGVAEEYVRDNVRADIGSDVSLATKETEDPSVDCIQEDPGGEEPTDQGVFACDVVIDDAEGRTLGREEWQVSVEIDPQSGDAVVRGAERLSSTITEAPTP